MFNGKTDIMNGVLSFYTTGDSCLSTWKHLLWSCNTKTKEVQMITNAILDFLIEHNLDNNIGIIGANSAPTIIGCKDGIINFLEDKMEHRVLFNIFKVITNQLYLLHPIQVRNIPTFK